MLLLTEHVVGQLVTVLGSKSECGGWIQMQLRLTYKD